jgi:LmbE family N-acetylglucosaminyl deacetylase
LTDVRRRTVLSTVLTALTSMGLTEGVADAADAPAAPRAHNPAHNDVLFVGAHPDDEMLSFATLGQWRERHGWSTGVLTVTRGEGGGNAVGLEEGPALGLIRETEERAATALAGIRNVFYLDKPDFWYTLSAPLTAGVWNEPDTLERVVRLIRETTPHTVITMDPRPFDQHGGHQLAARMAIEAFRAAGDAHAFPHQITREGLTAWRPRRLLAQNHRFDGLLGPSAAEQRRTDPDTGLPVVGVWTGASSRTHGATWAQVKWDAARHYATQGWAALPPWMPTDAEALGSEWFSVLAEDGRFRRRCTSSPDCSRCTRSTVTGRARPACRGWRTTPSRSTRTGRRRRFRW